MRIVISLFGEPKDENLLNLVNEYKKRTERYQEVAFKYFKKFEGVEKFLNEIHVGGRKIVLMSEFGKEIGTKFFAERYEKDLESGVKEVFFAIAPAEGWGIPGENLQKYISENFPQVQTLSLSKMTMQHDLAFLVLMEQVYRAVSIKNNLPYHK
jgi:23S rRNA (pseudouridine1915-N3)-methyltransferase